MTAVVEQDPVCTKQTPCETRIASNAITAGFSRNARFVVWWQDRIHIDVTKTRSHLDWSYNLSCVVTQAGKGSTWWRSGTGWSRISASSFISRLSSCNSSSRVTTDARYKNDSIFCTNVIDNVYDDVVVRGYANGRSSGRVGRTSATHCDNGSDLHWHARLISGST